MKGNGSKNSYSRIRGSDFVLSAVLGLGLLALVNSGLCDCTAFTGVSLLVATLSALLVGNRAFGSLTMEREKKTLDCLRLTQWSAQQILANKLRPELITLSRILIVCAPSVLILGTFGDAGLLRATGVLLISALGGIASAVFGIFVSSLSETTSQAYVAGRCGKGVWLFLTPVLDKLLSAVLVSTSSWPVFTSLNPWSATWRMALPESAVGAEAALPLFSLIALPLATLAMWIVACRRFDSGMVAAPSLTDRQVHPLYRNKRNMPGFVRSNPSLLRELAMQLRSGAGRWPGYTVFFVLFLAPYLYAQSWTYKAQLDNEQEMTARRPIAVDSRPNQYAEHKSAVEPILPGSKGISFHSVNNYNVRYVLKGHTSGTCLREFAYRFWGTPLPAHEMVAITERAPEQSFRDDVPAQPSAVAEHNLTSQEAAQIGAAGLAAPTVNEPQTKRPFSISMVALGMGLTGGITLLLIYLGIRCSGFLAGAVTGEKERSTWSDLILSGMSPTTLLQGKVGGSMLMPMVQMTVAFPSLLLFVGVGAVSISGVLGLYVYTLTAAITFALMGLWCSANSDSSHESHTKALAGVLVVFGVGTLSSKFGFSAAFVTFILSMIVCSGGRQFSSRASGAALIAVFISLVCPAVLSPLTASQSFLALPSLDRNLHAAAFSGAGSVSMATWLMSVSYLYCWSVMLWESVVSRLAHRDDAMVLDNERIAA